MTVPQGAHIRKLDGNSRVMMPEAMLRLYPKELVLTAGFDNSIRGYSLKGWGEFDKELDALNSNDPDEGDLLRFFRGMAAPVSLDGSNRFRIPETLMNWAGVDGEQREILVFDAGPYLEFWEAKRWNEFMSDKSRSLKDLARQIFGKRGNNGGEAGGNAATPSAGDGR